MANALLIQSLDLQREKAKQSQGRHSSNNSLAVDPLNSLVKICVQLFIAGVKWAIMEGDD